ncbi:hypothetical protein THAOC_12979 [Thalassiosira oceanica]|uniref:Uncharacterized protein n=1 Tax=Thalassiosira oceanica TaxID=159749 RepID=K0T6Q1_THAOC|nr:hypothetical protein THAOC_12979 [Thalassiosira oceanica]|eukprot:EJK66112.1 hypothetical protein THAOC_12979 [Thalassiosira oceanica]
MACGPCRKIDKQQKDPILNRNITWKQQNTISHVFSQWGPSIAVTLASPRRDTKQQRRARGTKSVSRARLGSAEWR